MQYWISDASFLNLNGFRGNRTIEFIIIDHLLG